MNFNKITLAALTALLFAACSDENKPFGALGGAEEEQGVYALAGRVGDVYPRLMDVSSDGPVVSLGHENSSFAVKGSVITISELDSLTLQKTGRFVVDTIGNDEGKFEFPDFTLESPYAMIEIRDTCTVWECRQRGVWESLSYPAWQYDSTKKEYVDDTTMYSIPWRTIVDVREYQNATMSINTLTNLKVPLLQKYFAEGMTFVAANKKAEQEVLEGFGIYQDLGPFEKVENENSELSIVLLFISHIVNVGIVFDDILPKNIYQYFGIPLAAVAALGDSVEQQYSNTIKMIEYDVGYYAHVHGFGQCTESRENETFNIGGLYNTSIVCRSNKWVPGSKKVEYVSGTMVDERDGKIYKTVTYNWGDVTQTWMAQNLNYVDTTSSGGDSSAKNNLLGNTRCWEGDSSCEAFGRYYRWVAAMDLDWASANVTCSVSHIVSDEENDRYVDSSEIVTVEEMCLIAKTGDPDSKYGYCSSKYGSECGFDYTVLNSQSGTVAYQGVCPEGWRMPNESDWTILYENMSSRGASLKDAYESGFGYQEAMTLKLDDRDPRVIRTLNREHFNSKFVSIPDFDKSEYLYLFYRIAENVQVASGTVGKMLFNALGEEGNVRCIKN